MRIWPNTSQTRIALLVLTGALFGLFAGFAVWEGSSAADNPGLALPAAVEVVASESGDRADTGAASAETDVAQSTALPAASAAARTISYTYDDAGRLTRVDYGSGVAVSYTYDAAGNLLRREVVRENRAYLPNVSR